jgi:tellurium resistance protein TerD
MCTIFLYTGNNPIQLPAQLVAGIGWRPGHLSVEPDIDLSAFLLGADERLPDTDFLVFYNNVESPDRALRYSGDPMHIRENGADQKSLSLDFTRLAPRIQSILLVATIHEAETYRHDFGVIEGAYVRLLDPNSGEEILRYGLVDDFAPETGLQFARFRRTGDSWQLEALGVPQHGGLQAFTIQYQ